ncbi:MAG: FG-GAP repeat protein [Planctomycetes bacterium]|nr:FG-GAP repeat protein [Planctomycetota bacterium]
MNNLCPRLKVVCVGCVWATLGVATAGAWGQCVANELAKVTASDAAVGDQFGKSVSISPDGSGVALIGVEADDDAGILSGSAYVYRFDPERSEWIEEQKLVASDGALFEFFGGSVAVSGDLALIGAHAHIHEGHIGAVYFFQYNGTTWVEQQELLASGGFGGGPISISGDLAVIGAGGDSDAGQASGAAYVFRFDAKSGKWIEQAKLTASDPEAWDNFGWAVSISGDVVLIGAPRDDDVPNDSGSAYVFVKPEGGWVDMTETAKLTASDAAAFDRFGFSVSISGDVSLIGAWDDDDAGPGTGSAYVFRYDADRSAWIEEQKLTASDAAGGDVFAKSVSLSGNLALISAHGNDDGESASGSAYVFHFDGSTWIEQAKLLASDPGAYDQFGNAVSISPDGVAVMGAFNDDDACPDDLDCDSGSAYIFGGLSDCNDNGELDLCDIADGFSPDDNNNGIPDECEPPPPECPGDLDGSGDVGVKDLLFLLGAWGPCPPKGDCLADFDNTGDVGVKDLLILLGNWGPCP